jgi:hypothetical protein
LNNISKKCGENSGKIWIILNKHGCLKKEKILEHTKLIDLDFHAGVGWLARENKIIKDEEQCYKLGSSNLDVDIGTKAGRVWKILDIWGEADYTSIKRLSDLNDQEIHTALGWLAREDKIDIDQKQKFKLK